MIAALALAARLVLAAVFAVAAAAKLRDPAGTRQAVSDFGAPSALARPLALLLPAAELAVATVLLPATSALSGAAAAGALLGVFSVAIGFSLARGRAPDCHCFGQLHSSPASWKTLVRNGVLAGLAAFAAVAAVTGPDRSAVAWVGRLHGAEVVAVAVAAASAVLLTAGVLGFLTLLRSYGGLLVRLDRVEQLLTDAGIEVEEPAAAPELGLEPGTRAPEFDVVDARGKRASLPELLEPGLPLLLLFTSPHCGPCAQLLPTARGWQRDHSSRLTVAFVSSGTREEIAEEADRLGLEHMLVDERMAIYRSYEANGTPSAVLVAPDGTIGSWLASGSEWIETLVDETVADDPGLPIGSEPPEFELPSLAGEPVSLAGLRGKATLLLFWNPDCGFCRSMHEDLLAWEDAPPNGQPELVVVSSGDPAATRAERFRSRVLLDEGFTVAGTFGAGGTPMAVLLDADGRVASSLAAGADAVLALIGAHSLA